jgi:hypothetical protein
VGVCGCVFARPARGIEGVAVRKGEEEREGARVETGGWIRFNV